MTDKMVSLHEIYFLFAIVGIVQQCFGAYEQSADVLPNDQLIIQAVKRAECEKWESLAVHPGL